jgi:hypothetical protein
MPDQERLSFVLKSIDSIDFEAIVALSVSE